MPVNAARFSIGRRPPFGRGGAAAEAAQYRPETIGRSGRAITITPTRPIRALLLGALNHHEGSISRPYANKQTAITEDEFIWARCNGVLSDYQFILQSKIHLTLGMTVLRV